MPDVPDSPRRGAFNLLQEAVEQILGVKLLAAEFHDEDPIEQISGEDGGAFKPIAIGDLPRKRRVKIVIKVKEKDGREITAIATSESSNGGTLRHPATALTDEFTVKEGETDPLPPKERLPNPDGSIPALVKEDVKTGVRTRALRYVQFVVSIINALINAGLIGKK